MLKKILPALFLILSLDAFSKTVLIPRPFLNPEVTMLQQDGENIPLVLLPSNPYYGARTLEKSVKVVLDQQYTKEKALAFKLGGTNRGPWNRFINVAFVTKNGEKINFPIFKSDIIGKGLTNSKAEAWVKLNKICEAYYCDFKQGINLYFYLDDNLIREIKPVYEWDHIIGVYYTLKVL